MMNNRTNTNTGVKPSQTECQMTREKNTEIAREINRKP